MFTVRLLTYLPSINGNKHLPQWLIKRLVTKKLTSKKSNRTRKNNSKQVINKTLKEGSSNFSVV